MSTQEQRQEWRDLADGLHRNYQDDAANAITALLADVDRLTAERDAYAAELAQVRKDAALDLAVIAELADEYGDYCAVEANPAFGLRPAKPEPFLTWSETAQRMLAPAQP